MSYRKRNKIVGLHHSPLHYISNLKHTTNASCNWKHQTHEQHRQLCKEKHIRNEFWTPKRKNNYAAPIILPLFFNYNYSFEWIFSRSFNLRYCYEDLLLFSCFFNYLQMSSFFYHAIQQCIVHRNKTAYCIYVQKKIVTENRTKSELFYSFLK